MDKNESGLHTVKLIVTMPNKIILAILASKIKRQHTSKSILASLNHASNFNVNRGFCEKRPFILEKDCHLQDKGF